MIRVFCCVLNNLGLIVQVEHNDVDVAIIIKVVECDAATDVDSLACGTDRGCYVTKSLTLEISKNVIGGRKFF